MRMFETEFDAFASPVLDFYPTERRADIDDFNGFDLRESSTTASIARASPHPAGLRGRRVPALRRRSIVLEARLAATGATCSAPSPVETDWRLFVTLIRFDPVYHGHFKCNLRRITTTRTSTATCATSTRSRAVAETVELRSHQAALLLHPRRHQPDAHRADRPGALCAAARARAGGRAAGKRMSAALRG